MADESDVNPERSVPTGTALELVGITKSFGANQVLKGVDLALSHGRVTALLGANGAGKSTLIKVLAGVHGTSSGVIRIVGDDVVLDSPMAAARHGVRTVHQRIDDAIVPGLSVAENLLFERIALGEVRRVAFLRGLLPLAREIADTLLLDWSDATLRRDVFELGLADQQLLLLARALVTTPQVLILDEPTSTLSAAEADRLFELIDALRAKGVAILYVSHRLSEVNSLADDLAVLRDGRIVDLQTKPFALDRAVTAMLSEALLSAEVRQGEALTGGAVAMRARGLSVFEGSPPIDLDLHYGEVTGIIGLIGAGKTELLERMFGAAPLGHGGQLELDGEPFAPKHPGDAITRGVHLVPEDRASQGMLPGWSIARTLSLPFLNRVAASGLLSRQREASVATRAINDFRIVTTGPDQGVDALSGGNQQKVMVARWMQVAPKVLLLDEPFRGVDIGARREISRRASLQAREGSCVVMVTSDVDELRDLADRIIVMVEGRVVLDERANQVSNEQIVSSMSEVA